MKKELSVIETAVLSVIPLGNERRVTLNEICYLTDLNLREVQGVINSLVFKYRIPICANRGAGGIFVPLNDKQRSDGLTGIKNQVTDLNKRISIVESADLINWKKSLALNYQLGLEVYYV